MDHSFTDRTVGIKNLILKALDVPENVENGRVNWNYVDADIHGWNHEWNLGFTDKELHNGLNAFACSLVPAHLTCTCARCGLNNFLGELTEASKDFGVKTY